jgi:hypothetical protein
LIIDVFPTPASPSTKMEYSSAAIVAQPRGLPAENLTEGLRIAELEEKEINI